MKTPKFEMNGRNYTLKAMKMIYYISIGLPHKQIADRMNIAKGTVDHRVADIFHKAGAKNSKELVRLFTDSGLKGDGTYRGTRLFKKGEL